MKKKILTLAGLFCFLIAVGAFISVVCEKKAIEDRVLRLHIVAHSDDPKDQAVKYLVRDRILKTTGTLFSNCHSRRDAADAAQDALGAMQKEANRVLQEHHLPYRAVCSLENVTFPTKHYGEVTLPGGRYLAVRVALGDATGQNWWCVLYPPLCLTDADVELDAETEKLLKENFSEQEYAIITMGEDTCLPIRFRFKLLEWLGIHLEL